ncbi:MAG: DUF2628 domain-containing protein [Isosphaeraceae bacterium]
MDETNPYAPPEASLEPPSGRGTSDELGPAIRVELEAFVGRNHGHYLRKWSKHLNSKVPATGAGFNFAAFLFGVVWLTYRKMYWNALIILGIMIVVGMVEEIAAETLNFSIHTLRAVDQTVNLGLWLACGFCGNVWYFRHALRQIDLARSEADAEGLSEERRLARIARRGGTSGFLTFLLLFGLVAVMAFLETIGGG